MIQYYLAFFQNKKGENIKDLRSITNTEGADDYRFHHWSYAYQYAPSDLILKSRD